MSEPNNNSDGSHEGQPINYNDLEVEVESVQEALDHVEDHLDDNEEMAYQLEDQAEAIEDILDDAQDYDEPARLAGVEEQMEVLREDVDDLQDKVDPGSDAGIALEEAEDRLYDVEEAVEDARRGAGCGTWDPYVVVNGSRTDVDEQVMTPKEILQEVPGHTPNDEVLYRAGDDSAGGDDFLPADKEIDLLCDFNEFTAYNHENPYGMEEADA